ncbi:SIP domain-containing protein [Brachybacterium paraconglomeratum]|uniref:SIP domain-containing protein n=1 Tax=Brachybacterium paraconglomeratum TaxID=173362 RepID=UPI0037C9AB67
MSPIPLRHLLIGDEHDLPLLGALLRTLPRDTVGELVLELPDERRPPLPTPPGVTTRHLVLGRGWRRGDRACAALEAWTEEWLLEEHLGAEAHAIFVGLAHNPKVAALCERLAAQHPTLHMHRPRHTHSVR